MKDTVEFTFTGSVQVSSEDNGKARVVQYGRFRFGSSTT